MKTKQLIGLQKDIYESMQRNGFIKSKATFHDSSRFNREAIFKAVLTLLDTVVNNSPKYEEKGGIIHSTPFE